MTAKPAISFVMPVYNGQRYLRQTLASIRWQTFSDWEAVCVDDGSTDESPEILREFSHIDSRIRIIRQENQGIVGALNTGVLAARAPWIARIDSDDIAVPERLAQQFAFIQDHPDVVAVGSDMLFIDPDGDALRVGSYATKHDDIGLALLAGRAESMAHPSVLMRRDAVIEAGLYRKQYEWVEDTDLWLRLHRLGRLANIPQILMHYRLHEQSVCWNQRALQRQRLQKLLHEAHAGRSLPLPESRTKKRSRPRQQSSAAGKWARQAARAGNFQTARKHWKSQVGSDPWSFLTFRVTVEMVLRGAVAYAKRRKCEFPKLPDWHPWGCTQQNSTSYCFLAQVKRSELDTGVQEINSNTDTAVHAAISSRQANSPDVLKVQ